ncbi:MAG: hypothetical protein IPK64_01170 [bacterium]|nr:hypothetical protein [bacterium]
MPVSTRPSASIFTWYTPDGRHKFTATEALVDATADRGAPLTMERSGLPHPRDALRMVPPV